MKYKIDLQTHFLPQGYIKKLEARNDQPYIEKIGDQYRFQYGENSSYFVGKAAYDIETVINAMDKVGIDFQFLSINIPGAEVLDEKTGIELARIVNDEYAEIIENYPTKFSALTTLPLRNIDASLKELDRATKDLDFRGIMMFSNVMGMPISDKRFWPIYEMAEQYDQPIYIHPTKPVMANEMQEYGLESMLGYVFDTSLAALKLILSGVFEKYPNLKVIIPHAGGTLPYLVNRIDYQSTLVKDSKKNISANPSEYIKKLYMDTVSLSSSTLKLAYDLVGEDRILFATDYPFVDMNISIDVVNELEVSDKVKNKIFHENANKLFKLDNFIERR